MPKKKSSIPSLVHFSETNFLKRFYLFISRKRESGGEREGEKHQCVVAYCMPPTGDLACDPGTCPDWESNRQPFGSQAGTQSTELHQLGQLSYFLKIHIGGGQKVLAHINLQKFVAC